MFQVLVSWPDDESSLGSKLDAIKTKLFTSEFVVNVNVCRYCIVG